MTTPTALDLRDDRPLTRREISTVLCGIVDSVIASDPPARRDLCAAIGADQGGMASALSATIAGLVDWCHPADVTAALASVTEYIASIGRPQLAAVG